MTSDKIFAYMMEQINVSLSRIDKHLQELVELKRITAPEKNRFLPSMEPRKWPGSGL